jgi:LacI family transcriptional regulator
MKVKATLKQIAKELNVSVSTVSKALNDSPKLVIKQIRIRNMQS